jgi:hypothetical protein
VSEQCADSVSTYVKRDLLYWSSVVSRCRCGPCALAGGRPSPATAQGRRRGRPLRYAAAANGLTSPPQPPSPCRSLPLPADRARAVCRTEGPLLAARDPRSRAGLRREEAREARGSTPAHVVCRSHADRPTGYRWCVGRGGDMAAFRPPPPAHTTRRHPLRSGGGLTPRPDLPRPPGCRSTRHTAAFRLDPALWHDVGNA